MYLIYISIFMTMMIFLNLKKVFPSYVDRAATTEDMWTPYKELQSLVEKYIISVPNIQDPQYHELTEALRNHRQNFLTILKNPVSFLLILVIY